MTEPAATQTAVTTQTPMTEAEMTEPAATRTAATRTAVTEADVTEPAAIEPTNAEPITAGDTRMTPLLARNDAFARAYTPLTLAPPTAQLIVLTCLDHRVDPATVLGLELGDAPVIRNAGGRVTPSVIEDLAYLAFLARRVFGLTGPLFEVAIIHHTQCGTGFLADSAFLREAATATGLPEATLAASQVADPQATVRTDVARLLASPLLSPDVSVSGHVYDIASGRVTTVLPAHHPTSPNGPATTGR